MRVSKKSDFVLIKQGEGTTRYKVKKIDYYNDPPDMWAATWIFSPRTQKEKEEERDRHSSTSN